jgi:hypothetical protein
MSPEGAIFPTRRQSDQGFSTPKISGLVADVASDWDIVRELPTRTSSDG